MFSKPILACFVLAAYALIAVQCTGDKGDKIIILPSKPKHQYYPIPIYYPTYSHYGGGYGGDHSYGMGGYGGGHDDHSSYAGGYGHMMDGMGGY